MKNVERFIQCPDHPLWEPMTHDSITGLYSCTAGWGASGGVPCPVVIRVMESGIIAGGCNCHEQPCNVPWHQPVDNTDPMPTVTLGADDILTLSALEAYRMAALARHYDKRAQQIYRVRQRVQEWQQRNPDKLKHFQWRDRNIT